MDIEDPSMYVVITTIAGPTQSVDVLSRKVSSLSGCLVVVGDKRGPESYGIEAATFLSLEEQVQLPLKLADMLPTGHYARKNMGYLYAIERGAQCIFETDDDNTPLDSWGPRSLGIQALPTKVDGWFNAYRCFTEEFIWPRGLPLDQVRNGSFPSGALAAAMQEVSAPIQQGLVDGSPDVDAVWRLLHDKPITFDKKPSICLRPGTWCPFNSQSTWWWPEAYPLMYLPSYCSFRMTDIWRSFVAQRCLWELGYGVVFHAAEVYQERNPHDLMKDFEAEIPGYRGNQAFVDTLEATGLKSGRGSALDNLIRCYERLIQAGFFPAAEMELVRAWAQDIEPLMLPYENNR